MNLTKCLLGHTKRRALSSCGVTHKVVSDRGQHRSGSSCLMDFSVELLRELHPIIQEVHVCVCRLQLGWGISCREKFDPNLFQRNKSGKPCSVKRLSFLMMWSNQQSVDLCRSGIASVHCKWAHGLTKGLPVFYIKFAGD